MTLKEYQAACLRTAPMTLSDADQRCNCALGLVGEFGEVVDAIKKLRYHGHTPGDVRGILLDELGDCLWYCAFAASIMGVQLERATFHDFDGDALDTAQEVTDFACAFRAGMASADALRQAVSAVLAVAGRHGFSAPEVMAHNVAKLRARYPSGFSQEASRGRRESRESLVDGLIEAAGRSERYCACAGHGENCAQCVNVIAAIDALEASRGRE